MARDPSLVLIDYTALWVALTGERRDENGRYPIRVSGDQRLAYVAGVWYSAVERAAFSGQRGYVTTAKRDRVEEIQRLADTNRLQVVDPGEEVARGRLADLYGDAMPEECESALNGWYRIF